MFVAVLLLLVGAVVLIVGAESAVRGTTRFAIEEALKVHQATPLSAHLEVETYTWDVLPGTTARDHRRRLIDGLTRELIATRNLLSGKDGS